MTVLQVLQSTTAYFQKRGIENPRLNAEHLIAHVLGKKRLDIYLEFDRMLAEAELVPLRELVRRRSQREPLQHVLGTVEFLGKIFICDKRALVPRPETEQLVELVQPEIGDPKSKILDVGTGSGVIALSLAIRNPEATSVGSDIVEDALALARENASRLGVLNVEFLKSDLFDALQGEWDVIVANLPYIARSDRDELASEVLYDPEIALFAGDRGDELIRRLIDTASTHLRPGGLLALEVGIGQGPGLAQFLQEKNYRDIQVRNDYSGVSRFLFARYG